MTRMDRTVASSGACSICYGPVGTPASTCPRCRVLAHPACLEREGCLTPHCVPRRSAPLSSLLRADWWKVARRCWIGAVVTFVGILVLVFGRAVQNLPDSVFWLVAAFLLPAALATSLACAREWSEQRGLLDDRWGTLAIVTWSSSVALAVSLEALEASLDLLSRVDRIAPWIPGRFLDLATLLTVGFLLGFLQGLGGLVWDRHQVRAALVAFPGLVILVAYLVLNHTVISYVIPGRAESHCYRQQSDIAYAVGRYDRDHHTRLTDLSGAWPDLLTGAYLVDYPVDFEGRPGSRFNYRLNPEGSRVVCLRHGTSADSLVTTTLPAYHHQKR